MPAPTLTYTLTNGTTADASQVMQNFNDLLNAMTDGTKDFSFSGLTLAGNLVANGNSTFGNATSDDVTFTGSLASDIPIKTTATYALGSSTKGLLRAYFGRNGHTVSVEGSSSMSADWAFMLPTTAGTNGYNLVTNGSGVLSWEKNIIGTSAKSADYTVLDTDGVRTVLMTTGSSTRTVTLPTASDNTNRILTIKKVDSGSAKCVVDGEGSETIDGALTVDLPLQYDAITIQCDGTGWYLLQDGRSRVSVAAYVSASTSNSSFANTASEVVDFDTKDTDSHSAVTTGASWVFTAPRNGLYAVHARFLLTENSNWGLGESQQIRLYKNTGGGDALYSLVQYFYQGGGTSVSAPIYINEIISLSSGNTIDIQFVQSSGTALSAKTSERSCQISIHELSRGIV